MSGLKLQVVSNKEAKLLFRLGKIICLCYVEPIFMGTNGRVIAVFE
jgi:hypothetical protein